MAEAKLTSALEAKLKAAAEAVAALEKEHGKGAVMKLGDRVGIKIPCIPTGIRELDKRVIQAGGFPRGRIVEIFGPESGGKTTLALQTIAEAQKLGGLAAMVDAEHALDPNWATKLGVDVPALFVAQPDYGEQALEITEGLVRSEAFDIVLVDSVAALVPKAELEGEMGDSNMGLHARLMSQAMRKLTGVVAKSNTCLVFINQIRDKIGVMFGSPETTTGGRALKFYASLRLDVRRVQTKKDGDTPVGNVVKIKAVKNKVGSPFRECTPELMFDKGFDKVRSVVDSAIDAGVIEQSGAWFSMKALSGKKERFQGKDNLIGALENDDKLLALLREDLDKAEETVQA